MIVAFQYHTRWACPAVIIDIANRNSTHGLFLRQLLKDNDCTPISSNDEWVRPKTFVCRRKPQQAVPRKASCH